MKKLKKQIKESILKFILPKVDKKKVLQSILGKDELFALDLVESGYLKDIGWWESLRTMKPQSLDGKPLPWVTYSFISFLESRLNNTMILFEFGSGSSTHFYANKVKKLYCVEHDDLWFKKVSQDLPNNVYLYFQELEYGGDYAKKAISSNIKFDVIIVDGRDRVNCIINSIEALSENGVIVLDDSERKQYQTGLDFLVKRGFKNLDLWGISPGFAGYNKCTSIYYKSNNVLGI